MGGGSRFPYPHGVWTPMGGWWNYEPKNWQRNTMFGFLGGFLIIGTVIAVTAPLKETYKWGARQEEIDAFNAKKAKSEASHGGHH